MFKHGLNEVRVRQARAPCHRHAMELLSFFQQFRRYSIPLGRKLTLVLLELRILSLKNDHPSDDAPAEGAPECRNSRP